MEGHQTMTEFQINDRILDKECAELAREILAEHPDASEDTLSDYAHDYADGHEWVIYNHKALMLCAHCNTENGEQFLDDIGFTWERDSTLYTVAVTIAYGEMRARIEDELRELVAAQEGEDA
jgi:hypothetical protein